MELGFRLTVAASLSLAPVAPLAARLAYLQVLRHGKLESRAVGEFARVAEEAAPRAELLDRKGNVLARSIPSYTVFADRAMVKDPAGLAVRLSPLIKTPAGELQRKLKDGRFPVLKARATPDEANAVSDARIEGIGLTPVQERVYPNGELGRGVLGLVGTEGRGLAGLELSLDKRLRGRGLRREFIRDGKGHSIFKAVSDSGNGGESVRLTLDRAVQYLAEEALRDAAGRHAFKEGYAAVQDPSTGEILALASWPANPLKNPLVQDAYEPGSTFKVVAALAAADEKLVRADERFSGEGGKWNLASGVTISDHEPGDMMTLAEVLEKSSNIGIAKITLDRVGAARFHRMSRALGFGARTGLTLPGETAGELKPMSDLTRVGLAASSYGYGLAVSPLQMLGAYSAIANGGTLLEPKLVDDGKGPLKVRRVASERAVRELQTMLEGVVDRGTASAAKIPGYRVAGKTGTARKLDPKTKRYSGSSHVASFAGWLPASKPRWTILVVVHEPSKGAYYGGQVAAPVFAQIARRLLALEGVAPDKPEDAALLARAPKR